MGQKINPNLFRLDINKQWKTEFIEKKSKELPDFIHKDLALQSFLERFLQIHNLLLHNYKIHYNENALNITISYVLAPKLTNLKKLPSISLNKKLKPNSKPPVINRKFKTNFKKRFLYNKFRLLYKKRNLRYMTFFIS